MIISRMTCPACHEVDALFVGRTCNGCKTPMPAPPPILTKRQKQFALNKAKRSFHFGR